MPRQLHPAIKSRLLGRVATRGRLPATLDFQMSERKTHKSGSKAPEKASSSIWNKDGSDFICLPQFHNSLPNAPSGPYLKNIELSHRYTEFSQYRTSSLEKNYIWQPHFGPDLGLRLDLVDQEAILNPVSMRNEDNIDASEMRLLKGDAPERGRGKLRSLDGGEKPWWLRNTTYLENNLYSSVVQSTNTDFKRKRVGDAFVSGIEAYISSFDTVELNVRRLAKEAKEKLHTDIEWSIPVLPGADLGDYLAVARFDEDPDTTRKEPASSSGDVEIPVPLENEAVYSILANIRQINPDEENTKTSLTSFYTSLVLPSDEKYVPTVAASESNDELNKLSEESKENGGDLSTDIGNSTTVLFKWAKNYSMDVNTKQDDSFVLTVQEPRMGGGSMSASSRGGQEGSVTYHPVRSRLLLKKVTDSDEHEVVVRRRVVSDL